MTNQMQSKIAPSISSPQLHFSGMEPPVVDFDDDYTFEIENTQFENIPRASLEEISRIRALPSVLHTLPALNMNSITDTDPFSTNAVQTEKHPVTAEFVAIQDNITVAQAIFSIREWSEQQGGFSNLSEVFIIDDDGILTGILKLSQLVLVQPLQSVSSIIEKEITSVDTKTVRDDVAETMKRHNTDHLPLVDESSRLVGVVVTDAVPSGIQNRKQDTEDSPAIVHINEGERALGPFWRSVRSRLPWLLINLITAIAAGMIIILFESTMAKAISLAAFLPIIAGQSGIAGTQTLTLLVRSIAVGELTAGYLRRLIQKELGLALVHGITVGLLVGILAFGWKGNPWLSLVAGVAMMVNMLVAGLSGVLVPLGLRAIKVDPALASAVAVTTATEVIGFLVYLGFATLIIDLIVIG